MTDRCTDPTCAEHWSDDGHGNVIRRLPPGSTITFTPIGPDGSAGEPQTFPPSTSTFRAGDDGRIIPLGTRDEVWVVSSDYWGQDGITIEGIFATEEAARKHVTEATFKLDYNVDRWDVLT